MLLYLNWYSFMLVLCAENGQLYFTSFVIAILMFGCLGVPGRFQSV